MERKSYFVGVDIGTSNVVMAVGSRVGDGPINIEDVISRPIESGVTSGRIDNVNSVGAAISSAKEELERELGIRINEAYAGISGEFVRCAYHTDHVFVRNRETGCISKEDMIALHERMNNVVPSDHGEVILERIPQNYIIDNNHEIDNPIGSFGQTITSTFMFILCQNSQLERVKMAFFNAGGLKLLGTYVNPTILPSLVLTEDEKDEGAAVVDIGGGTTDVAIVRGGKLRYIGSIPIGAQTINNDMRSFGIPERKTEDTKRKYGSAIADKISVDSTIPIHLAGQQSKKDLPHRNLVAIIEARLKDIIEFTWTEIKHAKMSTKIPCGLVLTGGTTVLEHIDELFQSETNLPARLSTIENGISVDTKDMVSTYSQSTAVAVMLKGASHCKCDVVEVNARGAVSPGVPPTPPVPPQPLRPTPPTTTGIPATPPAGSTPTPKPEETTPKPTEQHTTETPSKPVDAPQKQEKKSGKKLGGFLNGMSKLLDAVLGNDKDDVL